MKLGDLIVFLPAAVVSCVFKTIRTNIPEETKEYIEQKHLYHCTLKRDTANKIMETGHIKPSTGLFKNINSYGKAACCMFGGLPNMDAFIKNMSVNPYLEPDRIIPAIELDVSKEDLKNYKIRPFSDEAILYEGYCNLPPNKARIVELIADLKRDKNGEPAINEETGELYGIELRKRTEQEIEQNPDKYIPKEDYIKFVNDKKKQFGFMQGQNIVANTYNYFSNIAAGGKLEYNEMVRSTKKNLFTIIKEKIDQIFNKNKPKMIEAKSRVPVENQQDEISEAKKFREEMKVEQNEIKEIKKLPLEETIKDNQKNEKGEER